MTATTGPETPNFEDETEPSGVIPFRRPGTTGPSWPTFDQDDDQAGTRGRDEADPADLDQTDLAEADLDQDEAERDEAGTGSDQDEAGGVLVLRDSGTVAVPDDGTDPDRDEDEAGTVVLVDPPTGTGQGVLPWDRAAERRDVIPVWVRDPVTRKAAVVWVAGTARHVAAFHAARTPIYVGRLLVQSPIGATRLLGRWSRWVRDADTAPLRVHAIQHADAETHMRLMEKTVNRQRVRGVLSLLIAISAAVAAGTAMAVLPDPVLVVLGCVLVGLFGWVGTPADKPVLGRAVTPDKVPVLTSDLVIGALGALGIAEMNKALRPGGSGVHFPQPITRDGPGWRAAVDLPPGVTAADILDRRPALASALRRQLGCVWPEGDPESHEGRLVLWVGDKDMAQSKPAAWPLARSGQADVFAELPFGVDQRGRPVTMTMIFNSLLIGAMPRQGKTFALRVVLLDLALDPSVLLYTYELKGTGDLEALERVSHRYASGPGDDATLDRLMAGLREVYAELERRAGVITKLPKDLCPENKVTPDLSRNPKLGLAPIALAIDECQELFTSDKYGDEAEQLCLAIIKRGPALGIMLILATQRPDKDSLPTGISANVGIRFCLRVMGQLENDMILGTSAYRSGLRASDLTNRDKGIGILRGHADNHQITRTYYIDGPAAEKTAQRARALREAARTITGHAAGDTPDTAPVVSLLDDLAAVWPDGADKAWSETLCDQLAALRPDHYGQLDPAGLAAQIRPYGLKTAQVWGTDPATGKGSNRRGLDRADLAAARRKTTSGEAD